MTITDDSGFSGIANFHQYQSFVARNWDFEMIKRHIIEQSNLNRILFWGTLLGGDWRVKIVDESSEIPAFGEFRGFLEVSNRRLYLCNYETLTMAAQFEDVKLPEAHLSDLYIELKNGKYGLKIRQMYDPENYKREELEVDFEIVIQEVKKNFEIYHNRFDQIPWSKW
jgi:hypothetical protein